MSELADLAARVSLLLGNAGQGRVLLGIAGSPGSGKTTLAAALVAQLTSSGTPAVVLPMDGFHLANATLDRLQRRDRKGALDTFDGWGFTALIARVRTEVDHTVYAPGFERAVDEGVAGTWAIEPEHRVVVVEGNYLLVEQEPWASILDLLDEAWFCSTPDVVRFDRLVERHTAGGRTAAAAAAWAEQVDGANATLIEATRARADLVVSGVSAVEPQAAAVVMQAALPATA